MDDLDEKTGETLARFRFDPLVFARLRASLADSAGAAFAGRLDGELGLPRAGDLTELPALDSREGRELAAVMVSAATMPIVRGAERRAANSRPAVTASRDALERAEPVSSA